MPLKKTAEYFKFHSYTGATYTDPARNNVTIKRNNRDLDSRTTNFQG